MSTLESSLAELVRDKLITIDDAFSKVNNPDTLRLKLASMGIKTQ